MRANNWVRVMSGLQIIAGCCSADAGACASLLAANPDLSVDPDTTFNFCNLHGNVCTRYADRRCGNHDALAQPPAACTTSHSQLFSTVMSQKVLHNEENVAVCICLMPGTGELSHDSGSILSSIVSFVACLLRDGYLVELAMSGTGFACAFPSAQISVLKHLRRIDLSGSSLVGKCAPLQ